MVLIPLAIPPGVYRNGTELQSSGRWYDASLVRWVDGTMRPVGGRLSFFDLADPAPRGALAWRDLGGDVRLIVGTPGALYAVLASGAVTDISPPDLVAGDVDAVTSGYGLGFYGLGLFGVSAPGGEEPIGATTWSMDTWGEIPLACSTSDGRILEWDLDAGNDADAVANAPTDCAAVMVTDERFVFALGADGNPRRVAWSDREDRELWTAAATNEAGDIELQTQGRILCGLRVRGQALILTSQDAHAATYQGPPFVYGFSRVGTACGVVGPKAAVAVDGGAFWMGARGFYGYQGGAVAEVPCEVSDYVFGDINRDQVSKVCAVVNTLYGEVWWFYPSSASVENDRYVVLNYQENHWSIGTMTRTCGVDAGVFMAPIWFDADGVAYQHETGTAMDGAVFAETGPISIGNGDVVMSVNELIPDEGSQGDVTASFATKFYPNGADWSYGPYSMTAPTSVRFTGRQIKMRVDGARASDWRVGIMRMNAIARGRR